MSLVSNLDMELQETKYKPGTITTHSSLGSKQCHVHDFGKANMEIFYSKKWSLGIQKYGPQVKRQFDIEFL